MRLFLCVTSTRIEEENVRLDNLTEFKGDTHFTTWRPPWMTCFRGAVIPVKLLTVWKSDLSTTSRCVSVKNGLISTSRLFIFHAIRFKRLCLLLHLHTRDLELLF